MERQNPQRPRHVAAQTNPSVAVELRKPRVNEMGNAWEGKPTGGSANQAEGLVCRTGTAAVRCYVRGIREPSVRAEGSWYAKRSEKMVTACPVALRQYMGQVRTHNQNCVRRTGAYSRKGNAGSGRL